MTFLSTPNGFKPVLERMVHEPVGPMLLSYFLLVLPTVLFGFLNKDAFIGFGTNFWNNSIFIEQNNYNLIEAEFSPLFF